MTAVLPRGFVDERTRPGTAEWHETARFPRELIVGRSITGISAFGGAS